MVYDEFIKAYAGKGTDYDGAYGVQCVDLAKLYLKKVFNISAGSWGNAYAYFYRFSDKNWGGYTAMNKAFTKIANTKTFIPKKGDICVWNTNVGNGCGHISIATGEGTTSYFYSYDQNWNGKECKKIKHTYSNFYGVLRPKNQALVNPPAPDTHKVTDDVNVRTGPGVIYKKIDELYAGTRVHVYERKGTWAKIDDTQDKWVSANYLRII